MFDSPLPCTAYSTSSGKNYYKGYYYSATIPSVSTGTGTVQTTNYYNSESSCTGTPYSIMVQQTSACSTSTCIVRQSHHTSSSSCSSGGVATTTVGTVTTGFAIAAASYASTDTTCSSPVAYTIYPLSSCIPTSSSSHDDTSRGGAIGTADANGNIYVSYYSSKTCTGTSTSSSAAAKVGCTCSSTGCYTAWTYSATVPALSGTYQTTTGYSGSSCSSGTRQYLALQQTPRCAPATCISSEDDQSFSVSCTGTSTTTSNIITTGYAVINATYAASGTPPSTSSNTIHPL